MNAAVCDLQTAAFYFVYPSCEKSLRPLTIERKIKNLLIGLDLFYKYVSM